MYKTYKSLKQYAQDKKIWYAHFITKRNAGTIEDDLIEIPKGIKYLDKKSLLIHLLEENQKKMQ